MLLLEPGSAGPAWQSLAHSLPRPRAIVVVSAHWTTLTATVSACPQPGTIHDFHGFPPALYELSYPAPGAPELAIEIARELPGIGIDLLRGLDHGAWSPLRVMYPQADIPVIQLAVMPQASAATHYQLGQLLQPLTHKEILILASGGLTHNLNDITDPAADDSTLSASRPLPYVREFRDWFAAALQRRDLPALLDYRRQAPHAARAHPSPEHLLPLFVALGAAGDQASAHCAYHDYSLGALALDAFSFSAATA